MVREEKHTKKKRGIETTKEELNQAELKILLPLKFHSKKKKKKKGEVKVL